MRELMALFMFSAIFTGSIQAEYFALTDSYSVEVFDDAGALISTISLTGSGAASGTNLISATYGDFRGNGNELIVLRDSGHIEYYADPLTAGSSLARLGWGALEAGGRTIAGITTVAGGSNLAAVAIPGTNPHTYGYEYDGSLAGAYLDRINLVLVNSGLHKPYLSVATGSGLHATPGQDWAFLGEDGWVEVFSDATPGGAYERVAYFNAKGESGGVEERVMIMTDSHLVFLNANNQLNSFNYDGSNFTYQSSGDVDLATSSTLIDIAYSVPAQVLGYAGWAGEWGGVNIGSETNDYDGDGLLNIYEYGLGGDPTNAVDQGISPSFGILEVGGSNVFSYLHPQLAVNQNSGLAYFLELNVDLVSGTWTNDGYTVTGTNVTGGRLDFVTNVTDMADDKKFVRLLIE